LHDAHKMVLRNTVSVADSLGRYDFAGMRSQIEEDPKSVVGM